MKSRTSVWCWAALLLVSITLSDLKISYGSLAVYPPEIVIGMWLIGLVMTRRARELIWQALSRVPREIIWGAVSILIGGVVGAAVSPLFPQSLGALKSWVVVPMLFGLILLVVKPTKKELTVWMLVLAAGWLIRGVLSFNLAAALARLTGDFESANYLSMLIAPLLAWLYVAARQSKSSILWLAVFLIGTELVLTQSIGGLLGATAAIAGFEIFGRRKLGSSSLILIVLPVIIIGGLIWQRLTPERNSFDSRVQIWRAAGEMILEQPLSGPGLRGFEYYFPTVIADVAEKPIERTAAQPHNLLLSFWVNGGLLGIIGLVIILAWVYRRRQPNQAAFWTISAIFVHGLVDTPYWRLDLALMFWLYISQMATDEADEIGS